MKKTTSETRFLIDKNHAVPVYQQIVDTVLYNLKNGRLKDGDKLPSINDLSKNCGVSRATIEKSYGDLRDMGILGSHQGKGFFINNTTPAPALKILLLFNQLNAYNKIIYDSFAESLGTRANIDFYIYHNSSAQLKHLLKKKENYSHYVIIPHFLDEPGAGYDVINRLPKNKLILLGKHVADISGKFGAVYENFACDIYEALSQLQTQLRKYHTINLIHSEQSYFPMEITEGFINFCKKNQLAHRIRPEVTREMIRDGEAYVVISDDQMMFLVKQINDLNLTSGKNIGLISYNENSAKKVIMNGLTTISTDFKGMGQSAARMVLTGAMATIQNPFRLTLRTSL